MLKPQRWLSCLAVALALATSQISARAQTNFNLLHFFANSDIDGSFPLGQPVVVGPWVYGFTFFGGAGASSNGAIYQVSTNGSDFSLLYSFDAPTNGINPFGALVFNDSDSILYGMTFNGGTNDGGVVFGFGTDGSGYTVLHTFLGGDNDGIFPFGSPTVSDFTLFGMTELGGTNGGGVVFSMNTDGSAFTLLHSFDGAPFDGSSPSEGVVFDDTSLYGTTFSGGLNDSGTVFAVDLDGSNFRILYDFTGGPDDGAFPAGKLALSGTTLYGITTAGGIIDSGVVFRINTDGSRYSVLHQFAGGLDDGYAPQFGSLAIVTTTNSVIYGATELGGTNDSGVVYQMNTDGSGFSVIHTFVGGDGDGMFPWYGPVVGPSALYGTTSGGGPYGVGILYSIPIPTFIAAANVITNFQITGIRIASKDVVVTWTTTGTLAQTNQVQVTAGDTNGSYTNNFHDASGDIVLPAGTTTNSWTDRGGATNFPSRFYRVRLVP